MYWWRVDFMRWARRTLRPLFTRTVHITVTEDDLARGHRHSPTGCPVALATSRALGLTCWDIRITHNRLCWANHITIPAVPLPKEVTDRVALIDLREVVEPFAFDLRVPRF